MKQNTLKAIVYGVILIGVLTGLTEAASASSSVSVAGNGHYFEYNGKPVFLVGLGSWTPINHNDFDYVAHNQWYQLYGINYNRITLTSTWYTDHLKHVFPWNRSTTAGANDGGNKFELNDWDPVFWDRLKGYLQDCEDRGIIVCIQFFDECSVEAGSKRWNHHPFNPQNNINSIPDLDTTDASYSSSTGWSKTFYNVNNSVLMTLQDIYMQKLLDETSQYENVIYEMANEYGGEGSTQFPGHFAWPQHWIEFFNDYETANGVQLLLTNMPFGEDYDQAEYFAVSGIDSIDAYRQFPSYRDVQGVNDFLGAHYNKGKPIFAGKIGNDVGEERGNVNDNRKRLWTLFVSGGAGSGIKGSCWGIVDWTDDRTMEEMVSNIHNFIETGVEFWDMTPSDNLITSGTAYCLANVGTEYVVYLPDGDSVTVDLSGARGTLNVEWYNPKDGTYYAERHVIGGGRESFTPPFTDDAVLHISTDAFPPRTTSVITPTPNEAGWNNVTQVVVTFFRADNGTGISHTIYSKTSETGPWTTVGTSTATGPDAVNVTDIHEAFFNVTVLKEGLTEIWYYSVDNTSNIEHTKNVTVKIDTAPPIISIYSPENKTYHTKLIPLNFTANEPLDICLLSVDSTPNQTNCKILSVISREYEAREGTVAWWHFNGDAIDTSGNTNHGTITGASFVDGKFGSALKFDGINDRVSVNDSDSFDTINKTITIETWIKPVLTGNRTVIFYEESCFGFEITESGNVSFVLCNFNASCQRFDSKGTVKNNTWNHVTGTSDGTTMRLYINGVQDPITHPAPARIHTSNHSASIGIRQYGDSSFDYPFNGDIEELRILNRCLSEEQIKSDYALGEGTHSVTVYGYDSAGNWNSSTVYFYIVTVTSTPVFDTGIGTYPSISGLHNGTLKPNQTITVYKMYTYPCPGTCGHSEYVRIYNESGTVAKGNWTGYGGDWHNISFDTPFVLKANETYNYTIRTGSYPQIIHKPTANVTGGTITCEEFIDANGGIYNDWMPAFKLYSTEPLYQ